MPLINSYTVLLGNARLAEASLPRSVLAGEVPPPLRISQRMKLEASQLDGVNKRIKVQVCFPPLIILVISVSSHL